MSNRTPPGTQEGLEKWADAIFAEVVDHGGAETLGPEASLTDRLDHLFTHPVLGIVFFAIVMTGLFWDLGDGTAARLRDLRHAQPSLQRHAQAG